MLFRVPKEYIYWTGKSCDKIHNLTIWFICYCYQCYILLQHPATPTCIRTPKLLHSSHLSIRFSLLRLRVPACDGLQIEGRVINMLGCSLLRMTTWRGIYTFHRYSNFLSHTSKSFTTSLVMVFLAVSVSTCRKVFVEIFALLAQVLVSRKVLCSWRLLKTCRLLPFTSICLVYFYLHASSHVHTQRHTIPSSSNHIQQIRKKKHQTRLIISITCRWQWRRTLVTFAVCLTWYLSNSRCTCHQGGVWLVKVSTLPH